MDELLELAIIITFICMIAYLVRFLFRNFKETVTVIVLVFALIEFFPLVFRTEQVGNLDIIYILDTTCVRLQYVYSDDTQGYGCYPSYLAKQTINN